MVVDNNARRIPARELNANFIGKLFSHEGGFGTQIHARIAAVEKLESDGGSVRVYLDGVLNLGSTRFLTLDPADELRLSP